MNHTLSIKMGEIQTGRSPDILETMGVGSCMVIILYDPLTKIGGMAHAMLPCMPAETSASTIRLRYVDVTIDTLVDRLIRDGAQQNRLTAKLVGGAHMFPMYGDSGNGIGARNAEQARLRLKQKNIALIGEETGGSAGRNVRFDLASGICAIETRM